MIHYWANKRKTRRRLKEEDFQQSEFELQIPDLVQPFDQMVELHCQIEMKKREKNLFINQIKTKDKVNNFFPFWHFQNRFIHTVKLFLAK